MIGRNDAAAVSLTVDDVVREWWVLEGGAPKGVLPRGFNRGDKGEDEYMEFQSWCHATVNYALSRCGVFESAARDFLMLVADGGGYQRNRWVRVVRDAIKTRMESNPFKVVL